MKESEVPGQYKRTAEKMDETLGHKLREYGEVLPFALAFTVKHPGKFTKDRHG